MKKKQKAKRPALFSKLFCRKQLLFLPVKKAVSAPAHTETDPEKIDFSAEDVLVGSFRNQAQFEQNMAGRFYYTAKANLPGGAAHIQYIAACKHRDWQGASVSCYGKVTEIKTLPRRKIPVPLARNNGDEPYLLFRVAEWIPLALPIDITEGGVYVPKCTNLFLLQNSRYAFELFEIHSAEEYRLAKALRALCANPSVNTAGGANVEIGRFTLSLTGGMILLKDGRKQCICLPLAEYLHSPKSLYSSLVQYLRQ